MKESIESPLKLLVRVQKAVACKPGGKPQVVLQEIADLLLRGRRYESVEVRFVVGGEPKSVTFAGEKPSPETVQIKDAGKGSHYEVFVPVKIASRVVAVIVVTNSKDFSQRERAFLKQVGWALRRFVVSSGGRLLQRKLRAKREAALQTHAEARLAPAPDHSSTAVRPVARVATVS